MRRASIFIAILASACVEERQVPIGHVAAALEVCAPLTATVPDDARIVSTTCVAATATMPQHLRVLGCVDCEGAVYDAAGELANGAALARIPTSWILKIGTNWNGRVVVYAPGGMASHVTSVNTLTDLQALGFATVNANHPLPGYPGIPATIAYHPRELHDAHARTGRVVRDFVGAAFGEVSGFYGFGISRGMGAAMGTLLDDKDSPYDGYVVGLFAGYAGYLELEQKIWRSPDQLQPCTGLVTRATGLSADQLAAYLAPSFAVGDPAFHGTTQEYLDYDPPNAPGPVPDNWQAIVMDVDLQRPTIEIQGLRDRVQPPILMMNHATRIVTAGAADDYRLYLLKTRGHGFAPVPIATPNIPGEAFRDALLRLDTRVQSGAWPVDDAITERLASEAPTFTARFASSCQALMPEASWDKATCEDDPYKWDKAELQACPDPSHPKVRSCAPWACFFAVRDGS